MNSVMAAGVISGRRGGVSHLLHPGLVPRRSGEGFISSYIIEQFCFETFDMGPRMELEGGETSLVDRAIALQHRILLD
jgi:hypothetical protein